MQITKLSRIEYQPVKAWLVRRKILMNVILRLGKVEIVLSIKKIDGKSFYSGGGK